MSPARMAAKTSAGSSSSGGTRRGGVTGVHGVGPQVGPVEVGDPVQRGQVQHAGDLVAVLRIEAEPAQQQRARGGRHRPLDLEPDGLAESTPAELLLDRHQQVVGLVLLDGEVGVAGDPEQVGLDDLHAREEVLEVGLDDLVDRHEVVRLDLEQAGQDLGHLDPGEDALAGLGIAQADRDRQAQRRDVRERDGPDRRRAASGPGRSRRGTAGAARRGAPGRRRNRRSRCPRPRAPRGPPRRSPSGRRRGSRTRSRAAASCSAGVRPSGARATAPASICWRRPAMRTWKNSSRLLAKIARNLTRSSSGLRASRASWRTRPLNSSQDSSRLR